MTTKHYLLTAILTVTFSTAVLSQQKSPKRGIGWDEKIRPIKAADIEKLAPGISWVYTWAPTPQQPAPEGLGSDVVFVPMCWNSNYNEASLRSYLTAHPEVKYLLGFNEPNFSAQANMTPQQAANAWPKLEEIARDFQLKLVAPALNFTGERVGGKVWQPYEWYDEFFRLRPEAKVDVLALHCYMNWAAAVNWFACEYFYSDKDENLYAPVTKAKYPNLVSFLDSYKAANGHFPKMFLTEFCSWEDNSYPNHSGLTEDFQINQMTQKIQYLEQSDLVEGYAWFMANPRGGVSEHPHHSMFMQNSAGSELSPLGKVLVHMSSFDTTYWHAAGQRFAATDYIDSWNDNDHSPQLRPSTDTESDLPIEISHLPKDGWLDYQVELPADDAYSLTVRLAPKSSNAGLSISIDGRLLASETLTAATGQWVTHTFQITLPAGKHTMRLKNTQQQSFRLNWLRLDSSSGISPIRDTTPVKTQYYSPEGTSHTASSAHGLVIEKRTYSDGRSDIRKVIRK